MNGQRIGYVRVSTLDQNEKRQLEGQILDRVFTDKASGRDTARPQLAELLRFARDGDTVLVHSMDRLARNLDDLRALVQGLTRRGVRVEFLKENLTFTGEDSPLANLLLSVMGAFAEFERSLIRERQREGIALAKQRGATRAGKRCSHLNVSPRWSSVPTPVFPKSFWPVITESAGRLFTSTCAKPSWHEAPCSSDTAAWAGQPTLQNVGFRRLVPAVTR
ncbi:Resolvase domain protein [Arthrobacter nitrophenolicus]|uniref:Resolvase domain protein n=1 Tax=Arthrobacter nitrophenolicus TaxID=683150 RepID=L8TSZ4_9MICC|nr:Resolvase domain protein [Arthrobacter nitrophenolicus]